MVMLMIAVEEARREKFIRYGWIDSRKYYTDMLLMQVTQKKTD